MERVELTFSVVKTQLDAICFRLWSRAELNLFISLIEEYYKQMRRLSKQHLPLLCEELAQDTKRADSDDCTKSTKSPSQMKMKKSKTIAVTVNAQEICTQNVTPTIAENFPLHVFFPQTFPSEEQVAHVDRNLTRIRRYVQNKYPWGSLNEPFKRPYSTPDIDVSVEQREQLLQSVKAGEGIQGYPKANREYHLNEKRGEDPQKAINFSVTSSDLSTIHVFPTLAPPICVVDAFLYHTEDVEALVAQGKVHREYCRRCGSTEVGLVDFITHSFSQDQLVYLSCFLVPALISNIKPISRLAVEDGSRSQRSTQPDRDPVSLDGRTPPLYKFHRPDQVSSLERSISLVDVGSRLGVVLWSMYFAVKAGVYNKIFFTSGDPVKSPLQRVLGIECDPHFVSIQQEIGRLYCAQPFLSLDVLQSDCFEGEGASALQSSDFIILHNVFEYFCNSAQEHLSCWKRLRELVRRSGQILICSPSLEETLGSFDRFDGDCLDEVTLTALLSSGKETYENRCKNKVNSCASRPKTKDESMKALSQDLLPTGVPLGSSRKKNINKNWQKEWVESYVERVDIEQIVEHFLLFRTKTHASVDRVQNIDSRQKIQPLYDQNLGRSVEDYDRCVEQLDDASSCLNSIQLELEEQRNQKSIQIT